MAAAAAATATPSFSLSLTLSSSDPPQFTHHHHQRLPFFHSPPNRKHPCLYFQPKQPHTFTTFSSSSSSSSSHHPSSSSPSTSTATTTTTTYSSFIEDTLRTGRFLTNEELEKLKTLEDFNFRRQLPTGSTLWIRVMRPEEMDTIVSLLAESFAESMLLPPGYETLLRFFVKQYLIKRRAVVPHAVTLIGFYKGKGDDDDDEKMELAGTVEVCFDKRGANSNPATPLPPKNSPYICNMAVKKPLRRQGIGWNLLKTSEELISQMGCTKEVYLHCRMIDSAPFNMYTKAGYTIVRTDSIWILLLLQKRNHLMYKKLADSNKSPELDVRDFDLEHFPQLDMQTS